jgi:hypothetical protein
MRRIMVSARVRYRSFVIHPRSMVRMCAKYFRFRVGSESRREISGRSFDAAYNSGSSVGNWEGAMFFPGPMS